jgi:hypothetical protein
MMKPVELVFLYSSHKFLMLQPTALVGPLLLQLSVGRYIECDAYYVT